MLLRFDEYPYHQIAASFAGVAGSDPQWNDGHYVCLADLAGQRIPIPNVQVAASRTGETLYWALPALMIAMAGVFGAAALRSLRRNAHSPSSTVALGVPPAA